jgi:D-erythrulose 1-phosphate 3-epimerase
MRSGRDASEAHEPRMSVFGINLGFAIKRWPEPEQWAQVVREELELDVVQFSYDLLDPWWPEHRSLAQRARKSAEAQGIQIHSAQVGLAQYTYNGLLHPERHARKAAREWWRRGMSIAAELGASSMGGPVGALTAPEVAEPGLRERRYDELVETLYGLAEDARGEGLEALLVEPTPVPREIPSTIVESARLATDLEGSAVPLRYVLDVGHALFQPLYGAETTLRDWLEPLAASIGVLHLQNTDFGSDSHWGWPDERGRLDVAGFAGDVEAAGLCDVPVFIELFDAFEAGDAEVLARVRTSVDHCREGLRRGARHGRER